MSKESNFHPVILAGGRGDAVLATEPEAPRQAIAGARRQADNDPTDGSATVAARSGEKILGGYERRSGIGYRKATAETPKAQILAEPVGRNTAPAIGLAAFLLIRENPQAVIGMFPSDHVIADEKRYRETLERGIEVAAAGPNIVVLGIRPNRAETGYGYIEAGGLFQGDALHVRRFTEKPNAERAAEFVAAGNFFWNSGMFLWSAQTLADAVKEHLPKTAGFLEEIAASYGTRKFAAVFQEGLSEVRKH